MRAAPQFLTIRRMSACYIAGLCSFSFDDIVGTPRKIRQLIADLEKHGFVDRGGKGSHRNFLNPSGVKITLSGAPGEDAKHYLAFALRQTLRREAACQPREAGQPRLKNINRGARPIPSARSLDSAR